MDKETIISELQDILETEQTLTPDTVLAEVEEWDSLASISVLAFFKQKMNLKIEAQQIKNCTTVGDILKLAGE